MSRRKRRQSSRSSSSFVYSTLEPRQLLATLFSGTDGNDTASVTYVDETHVNVMIGETLTENVDITDGIRIDLGVGQNVGTTSTGLTLTFPNPGEDRITIDHRISGDLQIFNADVILVDGGRNEWQLGFIPDPLGEGEVYFDTKFGVPGVLAGRLNGNITFAGFSRIHGGDLGDVFTVNTTYAYGLTIYGGDGNDIFRFNATYDRGEIGSVVIFSGVSAWGEGGNDRFRFLGHARASAQGGSGYDIVDYSESLNGVSLNYYGLDSTDGTIDGNDRVIGAVGKDNKISVDGDQDLDWFINGIRAKVLDPNSGAVVKVENFNRFEASNRSIDSFYVLQTANEIEIFDADWIQISSEIDPDKGNLDLIQHDIKISRTLSRIPGNVDPTEHYLRDNDGVLNPTVVISDATSDGAVARFGKNQIISRMGGGNILFGLEAAIPFSDRDATDRVAYEPNLTFHGSRTGRDVFVVDETWGETTIRSHGGDDVFMVGSTNRSANGVLGKVDHKLNIRSGAGSDRLYVNDQVSEPVATESTGFRLPVGPTTYYSLSDTFLFKSGKGARAELNFNADLEFVRLNSASSGSSQVLVTPSKTTKFVISGKTEFDPSDVIGIAGVGRSSATINEFKPGSGSYSFGDEAKRIHFYNMTATLTDFRLV